MYLLLIFFSIANATQLTYAPEHREARADVSLSMGTMSNPLSLSSDEVASSFTTITPSFVYEPKLKNIWLLMDASLSVTDYGKTAVSDNLRQFSGNVSLGMTKFWGRNEIGLTGAVGSVEGREAGATLDGKLADSESFYGDIYIGRIQSWGGGRVYLSQSERRFQSLSLNEESQEFRNDFVDRSVAPEVLFNLGTNLDFTVGAFVKERRFREKTAKLTQGRVDLSNPILTELHQGADLGLSYQEKSWDVQVGAQVSREKDLIFGAEDADVIGATASLAIPVSKTLSATGTWGWKNRKFDNHRVDPNDLSNSDRRQDIVRNFRLGFELALSEVLVKMDLAQSVIDSNYVASGASYENQTVSLGLDLEL